MAFKAILKACKGTLAVLFTAFTSNGFSEGERALMKHIL